MKYRTKSSMIIIHHRSDLFEAPNGRPQCCGKKMGPAGGNLTKDPKKRITYWKCWHCGNEIEDIPCETLQR